MGKKDKKDIIINSSLLKIDQLYERKKTEYNIDLDKILCYIIGGLLTVFIIMTVNLQPNNNNWYFITKVFLISSSILLVVSLLSFVRQILRYEKRLKNLTENLRRIIKPNLEELIDRMREFSDQYLVPAILYKAEEAKSSGKSIDSIKEEAMEEIKNFNENSYWVKLLMDDYLNNTLLTFKKDVYLLSERFSKINYYIDLLAERSRYSTFVLGVTFFLIATISLILQK